MVAKSLGDQDLCGSIDKIWSLWLPMWVKQDHKPPKNGNGIHTTYKNGDDWGMVYDIVLLTLLHVWSLFSIPENFDFGHIADRQIPLQAASLCFLLTPKSDQVVVISDISNKTRYIAIIKEITSTYVYIYMCVFILPYFHPWCCHASFYVDPTHKPHRGASTLRQRISPPRSIATVQHMRRFGWHPGNHWPLGGPLKGPLNSWLFRGKPWKEPWNISGAVKYPSYPKLLLRT
jgi:hypothetical protein